MDPVLSFLNFRKPRPRHSPAVADLAERRNRLAADYLRGQGIEIGALHFPLQVPRGATVRYVDRLPALELRRQYPELEAYNLVPVDIVDDGERLTSVADESQDFVIANHFLEHCEDPIGTLRNFFRVVKPEGILYLSIPDKRYTFDRSRPVTPLNHLIRDHEEGPEWSRRGHYEEWARYVWAPMTSPTPDDDAIRREAERLLHRRYSIHFHVWTQVEMIELMSYLRRWFRFDFERVDKHGFETVLVLRKGAAADAAA